jgi:hypothetical protein
MKEALKFCEDIGDLCGPYPYVNETSIVADSRKVLTALRQAIAEDKWEPQIEHRYSPNGDLISITIKRTPDGEREQIHPPKRDKHEPVAWREVVGKFTHYYDYNEDGRGEPLYAAPVHAIDISQECVDKTAKHRHELVGQPDLARVGEVGVWGHKREWVGLTDDEIWDCYTSQGKQFYLAIEAKLKEKNT